MLAKWNDLPDYMKNEEVFKYYEKLANKRIQLFFKRLFDIIFSIFLLIVLSPVLLIIAILIRHDSNYGVFFRQERVTKNGKVFKIHKFRTMIPNAHKLGSQVTTENDIRVTKIGHTLRKYRLDEIPQLIDIVQGNMSFVGVRPEVVKYVKQYTPEMYATLLLPAGVTSIASITFKDESELFNKFSAMDVDRVYIDYILPEKMKYNLKGISDMSLLTELKILFHTLLAVIK